MSPIPAYFLDGKGNRYDLRSTEPPPSETWYWTYPDQFYREIRSCAPCPAVMILGEIENNLKSHSIIMTEEMHWFIGDLFALSRYGLTLDKLMPNGKHTDESLNIARAVMGVFGPQLAFSNTWDPGPFKDYIKPENLDGTSIVFDKIRTTASNSHQSTSAAGLVQNSKGNWMLPLVTFNPYDLPTGYGVEILDHPAIQFATIQKATGAVRPFPQLDGYDVPIPVFAKPDKPVYTPAYTVQTYTGQRRPPYYSPPLAKQLLNLVKFGSRKALAGFLRTLRLK